MTENERDSICEARSISLPVKVRRLLQRLKNDRQDPTLSTQSEFFYSTIWPKIAISRRERRKRYV